MAHRAPSICAIQIIYIIIIEVNENWITYNEKSGVILTNSKITVKLTNNLILYYIKFMLQTQSRCNEF